MNREIFLKRLEELLQGLPTEERENALIYYTDYFDDAGVDDEARIIEELGSPEKIANMLLREYQDLKGSGQEGEYTEYGYVDPNIEKDPFEIVSEADIEKQAQQKEEHRHQGQTRHHHKNRDTRDYRRTRYSNNSVAWILIIVFTFPIWFSVAATMFALLLTLVALGVTITVAFIGGGVFSIGFGLTELIIAPMEGILAIGVGLGLIGLGIICGTLLVKGGCYGFIGVTKGLGNFFRGRGVNHYENEK